MQLSVIDGPSEAGLQSPQVVAGELTPSQFKSFLSDIRWQPTWRNMADKCVDYYDGNQLDQDTLTKLQAKGMGPLIRNITAPLVNVVLGMEAKTRTDWRVVADTDMLQEVAEALSAKLHETERESRADRACSDAYAAEVKAGLGWVEVSRNADPFAYPYRCQYVHRREIYWDWRDESPDLSKARYLVRKRWFDLDQAVAYFPEQADLLRAALGDPNRYELITSKRGLELGMQLEEMRGLDIEDIEEWRSFDRQRLCLYEVWYRVFVRGWVAKLPNNEIVEVDTKNPVHLALLNRGAMRAERAVYSKLRMSIWAGPHKLMDCACEKRHIPYIPFWGYREDRTGVPYGLIRAMLSPQDEVNARLQKMMWLLGAKRVLLDSDALDPAMNGPRDMLAELGRPDAAIFLNPNRTNRDAIKVDDNLTLADAQFKVLMDAKQASQEVVGVFNAMLGRETSTTANSALITLVDQGTTALAEINDNYRYARRLVGERLIDHVRDDLMGQRVEVSAGEQGRKRTITLNNTITVPNPQDPNGPAVQIMQNDVGAAKVKVALDDVLSSAAYREQQFTMLAEMTKGLPPQLQAVIAPFVMEASDLQKRREIADTLRKAMGQPIPKTPEEEKQAEAAQAEAMQFAQNIQRKQALLELAEREAKVKSLEADAMKAAAEGKAAMAKASQDPNLAAAMQTEFDTRVAAIQAQAKTEIDRITAQLMTLRMNAATREQKLLAQLSNAAMALKVNANNAEAAKEKLVTERAVAQITADKDRDVAKIEAESASVVQGMVDEIAKLRSEMEQRIAETKREADKALDAAKKEAEKQRKEEERERREEEKRRGEEERSRRDAEAKSAKDKTQDTAAPVLNLNVSVDGGGEREISIVKTPEGMKATSKPKRGAPKK